ERKRHYTDRRHHRGLAQRQQSVAPARASGAEIHCQPRPEAAPHGRCVRLTTRAVRAVSIAISTWTQQVACIPPVEDVMPEISDSAVVQQKLGSLPIVTYQAGETVLAAGSRSGQLLILKSGAVAIIKEDIEITKVREPGAVLGELSALLDQPHTADV